MARAKYSVQSSIEVDGVALLWHLHRDQQCFTSDDGWKGVAIHVRAAEGVRRELFLEYPAVANNAQSLTAIKPTKPAISVARVQTHIREAITAGWDPESRGKPFLYHVEELPG